MSGDDELRSAITELVRALPGVAELYSARPLALAVVDQLLQTALPSGPTAQLIAVSGDAELTRVELRIAVTADMPAADTIRQVHAAVAELLARRGIADGEIRVTVARIV